MVCVVKHFAGEEYRNGDIRFLWESQNVHWREGSCRLQQACYKSIKSFCFVFCFCSSWDYICFASSFCHEIICTLVLLVLVQACLDYVHNIKWFSNFFLKERTSRIANSKQITTIHLSIREHMTLAARGRRGGRAHIRGRQERNAVSSMKKTQALDMFPYSLNTWRVAFIFSAFSPSFISMWSRMVGPPGWAIQKREFQSLIPRGLNASSRHFSMFFEMRLGTVFWRWKVSPTSVRCPSMAPLESGRMVYAADTISKIGSSPREVSGSELLLEVGHVLTVGDVEVVVWILLEHLVWQCLWPRFLLVHQLFVPFWSHPRTRHPSL